MERYMQKGPCVFLCALAVMVFGCDVSNVDEAMVAAESSRFSRYVCAPFVEESYERSGEVFSLEVYENTPAAVLAYPRGGGMPLGTIYPFGGGMDEAGGFAATVLYELYNPSQGERARTEEECQNILLFNWPKFIDAVREKSLKIPLWQLDRKKIEAAVLSGSFRKSDIKDTSNSKKRAGKGAKTSVRTD